MEMKVYIYLITMFLNGLGNNNNNNTSYIVLLHETTPQNQDLNQFT